MSENGVRLDASYIRSERMVGRSLAEEYLLVPLVSRGAQLESIYNLNPVAAFIWERLDGRNDGNAIVRAIVERFDVDQERAARDYAGFLRRMLSIRAIAQSAGASLNSVPR